MNDQFTVIMITIKVKKNKKPLLFLITDNLTSPNFNLKDLRLLWAQDTNQEKHKLKFHVIFMITLKRTSKKSMNKFMKY